MLVSTLLAHIANRTTIETPAYLIDLRLVTDHARILRNCFLAELPDVRLAYPMKANPVAEVASAARSGGYSLVEVSSDSEAWAARAVGLPDECVVVGGVGKQTGLLARMLRRGCIAKLDSPNELGALTAACAETGTAPTGVLLRVATLNCGNWSRFGFLPEELPSAIDAVRHLEPRWFGFHFHLGSKVENPWAYTAQIVSLKPWVDLVLQLGCRGPAVLSVGGGFGLIDDTFESSVRRYVAAIASGVRSFATDIQQRLMVIPEPGRITLETAGWLLASVTDVKLRPKQRLAILDVTQSMLRSGAPHEIRLVDHVRHGGSEPIDYTLVGCLSYETDILSAGWKSPAQLHPGDRVALGNSGAYAIASAAPWTKPIPPILGWDGTALRLLRPPVGW